MIETNMKKYGVPNVFQNDKIKTKIKATIKDRYDVDNISQSPIIIAHKKETMMRNYGVTAPLKSEIFQDKLKMALLKKYGSDNASKILLLQNKKKQTWMDNYGVDHPFKSPNIKLKIVNTLMDKYGVDNPTKDPEICERQMKSAYNTKLFVFPSGTEVVVQGYEHHALKILVSNGYTENDIVTKRTLVPKVEYVGLDHNIHRYYTDIYIPKENRMIEVKSSWTAKLDKEKLEILTKVCNDLGYIYEIWVFDAKLQLTIR
jgi:hypothetical protein